MLILRTPLQQERDPFWLNSAVIEVVLSRMNEEPEPDTRGIPVLIDTGFQGSFAIGPTYMRLAKRHESEFFEVGRGLVNRVSGGTEPIEVSLRAGVVWIRSTALGKWVRLSLSGGFTYFAEERTEPEHSLIGVQAFSNYHLTVSFDYDQREVRIESPSATSLPLMVDATG